MLTAKQVDRKWREKLEMAIERQLWMKQFDIGVFAKDIAGAGFKVISKDRKSIRFREKKGPGSIEDIEGRFVFKGDAFQFEYETTQYVVRIDKEYGVYSSNFDVRATEKGMLKEIVEPWWEKYSTKLAAREEFQFVDCKTGIEVTAKYMDVYREYEPFFELRYFRDQMAALVPEKPKAKKTV